MDAMEGRGVSGGGKGVRGIRTAGMGTRVVKTEWIGSGAVKGGGTGGAEQNREALERLLEMIRLDVDAVVEQKAAAFEGVRSEVVLRRVLARVQEGRQRGAWLLRAVRTMTAMGAALWNSRAFRMLMP